MTIKPIQNEKSILAGIKKDSDSITHHKNQLLKYAFSLGEKLIEAKRLVGHGNWMAWLNSHSECEFGDRQADKYMQIASEKAIVNALFSDIKSVNGLVKALASVTEDQRAEIERHESEKAAQVELDKTEKSTQLEAKKAETVLPVTPPKEPEVIEGDFKEIEPTGLDLGCQIIVEEPEHEEIGLQEAISTLSERNDELEAEIQSIAKIFESNNQLSDAAKEIKKFTAVNSGLESTIRSLQNEKAAMLQTLKYWEKRYKKLEKLTGQSVD